ncbi:rCG37188 [Rattus norvegicus]|uniref:RCG37188 n=1 Tax=Rattus norvegicus TaxID=10116 RepID=A6HUC7_RAT|nr:rCG37188 [Rattus norvegicus]
MESFHFQITFWETLPSGCQA